MIYASPRDNLGKKQMFLMSNKEFVVGKDAGQYSYIIEYEPLSNIDYEWIE